MNLPIIHQAHDARGVIVFSGKLIQQTLFFACLLGCVSVYAQDQVTEIVSRIWTGQDGTQVSAKFVAKLGDVVKVEKYNGEMVNLSYNSLVAADKSYVDVVVRTFGSAPGARTWSDVNGQNFRGSFVRLRSSELEFMLVDNDETIQIETLFVSSQDIEFILEELNRPLPRGRNTLRYRVWAYRDDNQNELRIIGRYRQLNGDNVMLAQPDGNILIPLSRLLSKEWDYILNVDESTRSIIDPLRETGRVSKKSGVKDLDVSSSGPSLSPIWWISFGLIFLLMLGLISIKYVYESGEPEFDDEI